MTHTEESLMALADEYAFLNRTPADSQWSDPPSKSAKAALRLAIREVLAERNTAIANMQIATVERRLERERAEKAEAENAKLKQALGECTGALETYRHPIEAEQECAKLRELLAEANIALKTDDGIEQDRVQRKLDAALGEKK